MALGVLLSGPPRTLSDHFGGNHRWWTASLTSNAATPQACAFMGLDQVQAVARVTGLPSGR